MKKTYLLLLSFLSLSAFGLTIEDEAGKVSVDLPSGWTYEKNLLGLPHVLLSPGEGNRVSLSLTLTGIGNVKLSGVQLKKNQIQYQQGRRDWAEKKGIEIKSFVPYREFKIGEIRAHEIGVEYSHEGKLHRELSYYVECPRSLVHLKGLGHKDSAEMKKIEAAVKSLRCF